MRMFRYQYLLLTLPLLINGDSGSSNKTNTTVNTSHSCPFTRIIEDIVRIKKKYSERPRLLKDGENTKIYVNSITNLTTYNNTYVSIQEELINDIIASINRIKNNMSSNINTTESRLNEAIILKVPENDIGTNETSVNINTNITTSVKSGIEIKTDVHSFKNSSVGKDTIIDYNNKKMDSIQIKKDRPDYVEILTIEPNNTSVNNTTQHNIIEVLKHLMPMLNSTTNKQLHSVTIIERNRSKNQSVSETKNISTVVVKYCDKANATAANLNNTNKTQLSAEASSDDYVDSNKELPVINQENVEDDYDSDKDNIDYKDNEQTGANTTINKNKDVLEAAKYGIQKMHELYSVLEPKLYSMGLWLDDTNPARYVAAFNAPSEDIAKYSHYGYATLQAAAKLKELNGCLFSGTINPLVQYTQFLWKFECILYDCVILRPLVSSAGGGRALASLQRHYSVVTAA